MKNIIFFVLAITLLIKSSNAQTVDQSINGVQLGFLGVWLHNESKINTHWAFRTEIGYEASIMEDNEFPLFLPVVSIEPRWYYNSRKRQGNSNNTFHNSTNFATMAIRYYPEILGASSYRYSELDGGLFLIPSWGIRRNISYRMNYELGVGAGIDIYELITNYRSETDFMFNLHIRIGYKFGKSVFQKEQ